MRRPSIGLLLLLVTASARSYGQVAPAEPRQLPSVAASAAPAESPSGQSPAKTAPCPAGSSANAPTGDSCTSGGSASDAAQSPLYDDHQGPPELLWFRAGYLMYWTKQGPLSGPLVTTGPADGTGSLSDPRTKVLYGNSDVDYGRFNGMQYDLGAWLDDQHVWGIAASGFLLEQRAVGAQFNSDAGGSPLLARPFNNITTIVNQLPSGTPVGYQVTAPGAFSGGIDVESTTRLWGAEVNAVRNLVACPGFTFDLVAGFRYIDLEEQLLISSQSQQLAGGTLVFDPFRNGGTVPATLPGGSVVSVSDRFHTRNQFYGGQGGLQAECTRGAFSVSVLAQLAVGPNHETVSVAGQSTARTPDGATQSLPSGLYADTGTNTGRSTTNWFALSPEVDVRCGYHFTESIFAFVGYNFLYLNNVARPGTEVNENVNLAFVPTSLSYRSFPAAVPAQVPLFQPAPLSKREDFWAQGLQFGVEFKY